ncbi:orotidine-5'-phosphate decarboxylase [Hankyongella ginsenosidimutans]|uniref:orotidine-5'-phosphate decarboxylase n=1 Tax=Hankyongella ginsenosidimutans TaxID=1763828 RepID=UPI001CA34842|nr:orotidine-5'-phosphate decarboxylase [Hankyongella ginsenosidimutans]
MAATSPIYCALDVPSVDAAIALGQQAAPSLGGIKLGLEFFCANGLSGVRAVNDAAGLPLFLDLKFHDIPNTVAAAVRSVMPARPAILTVHAQGGVAMLQAARTAAHDAAATLGVPPPRIVAVTVLTSLDSGDLAEMGVVAPPHEQALVLAAPPRGHGWCGLLGGGGCRRACRLAGGVPRDSGIRPLESAAGDQKRVMTPRAALAAGSDVLVIGRPITDAANPAEAARMILASL